MKAEYFSQAGRQKKMKVKSKAGHKFAHLGKGRRKYGGKDEDI